MLVSADARVEPRLDIRADARPALGYSDSGLFWQLCFVVSFVHLVWGGGMYARLGICGCHRCVEGL